jgi:hypothetical protein
VGFRQGPGVRAAGLAVDQPRAVLDVEGQLGDDGFDFIQVFDQVSVFVGSDLEHGESQG